MKEQDKKRPAHRPRKEAGLQKRRNISLSDEQADRAKKLSANGQNLSEGIRVAIDRCFGG